MAAQVDAGPAKGARRTGLWVFGLIVLFGGLAAGVILWVASTSRYEDAVKNLQRAPVGCDTEFNFTGTGTFIFYTETKGQIGDLRGDCQNTNTEYDRSSDRRPRVSLTLVDKDGEEVDLQRSSGASYDAAGYVGSEIRSLNVDEPAEYTLTVESDDTDFAIAVGRNPKEDADSMRMIAIIVAAVGLVLGLLLILLGMRRKRVPATPISYPTTTYPGAPPTAPWGMTSPPAAPPYSEPAPPPLPTRPPPGSPPFTPPPPPPPSTPPPAPPSPPSPPPRPAAPPRSTPPSSPPESSPPAAP